jgi:hypothetical protein
MTPGLRSESPVLVRPQYSKRHTFIYRLGKAIAPSFQRGYEQRARTIRTNAAPRSCGSGASPATGDENLDPPSIAGKPLLTTANHL